VNAIIVQGTLKPDGTLVLDEKPALPPGRVQITLQPAPEATLAVGDWWECLQRIRAEREARGYPFMTEEETTAWIEELRDQGEDRIDEAHRILEEERPPQG
jgi:hypothetical protein